MSSDLELAIAAVALGPLHSGPGVIAAADAKSHAILLELITSQLPN